MLSRPVLILFLYFSSMLGFSQPLCSVSNARFGAASPGVPVWMDRLQCNGRETALDQCTFSGWGENSCSHRDDAGVICFDGKT